MVKKLDRNDFSAVQDKVCEAQNRMIMLSESAPLTYNANNFSPEGLSGLGWLVGDIIDCLQDAQNLLKKISNENIRR